MTESDMVSLKEYIVNLTIFFSNNWLTFLFAQFSDIVVYIYWRGCK